MSKLWILCTCFNPFSPADRRLIAGANVPSCGSWVLIAGLTLKLKSLCLSELTKSRFGIWFKSESPSSCICVSSVTWVWMHADLGLSHCGMVSAALLSRSPEQGAGGLLRMLPSSVSTYTCNRICGVFHKCHKMFVWIIPLLCCHHLRLFAIVHETTMIYTFPVLYLYIMSALLSTFSDPAIYLWVHLAR